MVHIILKYRNRGSFRKKFSIRSTYRTVTFNWSRNQKTFSSFWSMKISSKSRTSKDCTRSHKRATMSHEFLCINCSRKCRTCSIRVMWISWLIPYWSRTWIWCSMRILTCCMNCRGFRTIFQSKRSKIFLKNSSWATAKTRSSMSMLSRNIRKSLLEVMKWKPIEGK